ncbi:hypothetical protein SAMN06298216_1570 [Spirosomataceae bacterium TFI 002]|nr:hypothetical protein SAMN06298216_1570 [Spirosomataceae bacterium TFI 002]
MKLNAVQISRVEEVLAEQKLVFKDFENEMVDHICSKIENEYREDADFEVALHNELYAFQDHFFKVSNIIESGKYFTGIRALEMERFKEINRGVKRAFLNSLKRQILTWRLGVWAILFLLFFEFENYLKVNYLGFENFSDGAFAGAMMTTFVASTLVLFSNSPMFRSEPASIFQYLPNLHALLKPEFGYLHSLKKMCCLPICLFSLMVNIQFWFSHNINGLTAVFTFAIILSIYLLVTLYFYFKKTENIYRNS